MEDSVVLLAIRLAYVLLTVGLGLATWRLLVGPSVCDRVVALDVISAIVMGFAALFTLESGTSLYLDVALVIAMISFLATVAFARYLERGISS